MKYLFILSLLSISGYGQPNCNVFKFENNEHCYEACMIASEASIYQGSKESQVQFDSAIALCPGFDYAYMEKSIPYLKRGDFITWKKLIDKAVELNPSAHLGYRGWCRYQFLRDYKGAIRDFEELESLIGHEIGYSQNGDYHLNIAKALCYKALGMKQRAINIIEDQLSTKDYLPMPYDYLHLGVLKLDVGDADGAIAILKKQIAYNDYLAETYYYLALASKRLCNKGDFEEYISKAKTFYIKRHKITDPYTHPMDKIFLADIEKEVF